MNTRTRLICSLAAAALLTAPVSASPQPSAAADCQALVDESVLANRILANEGVLDGYGHVSVRSTTDPGAVELDPSLYDGHVALALAHRELEEVEPWRAEAQKAIEINSRAAEGYALLADSYFAAAVRCRGARVRTLCKVRTSPSAV